MADQLTPEMLMRGYLSGIFPMAETRNSPEVHWVRPRWRGILPLDGFHISRSLRRTIRRGGFEIRLDTDFEGVLDGCAARPETWINAPIRKAYLDLHHLGAAHSLEVVQEGRLAGGVYGVAIGGAFFGESMFSRRRDASKLALAWLVTHLRNCGFRLFDTQFITPHLASLGGQEIPESDYMKRLEDAVAQPADIRAQPLPDAGSVLQRRIQTS